MNLKTTPEERAAYRAGLLNRIKDARRMDLQTECKSLNFQLAVLDDLEYFITKHETDQDQPPEIK